MSEQSPLLDKFFVTFADLRAANPRWRTGQAAWHALDDVSNESAERLCKTTFDPYHRNECGTDFWNFIFEELA